MTPERRKARHDKRARRARARQNRRADRTIPPMTVALYTTWPTNPETEVPGTARPVGLTADPDAPLAPYLTTDLDIVIPAGEGPAVAMALRSPLGDIVAEWKLATPAGGAQPGDHVTVNAGDRVYVPISVRAAD